MIIKTASVFCLLFSVLISGCGTQSGMKAPDGKLQTGASWEVNRAVMVAAENSGNNEIALKTGEEELKQRPDNVEAKIFVARLLCRTGQPQRSSSILETIKSDPDGRVLIERARTLIALDLGSLARQLLDEPEEMDRIVGQDNKFEARKLLAVAYDLEGENHKAQALYSDLLSQKEDSAVRMNYGRSLIATKSYAQAATILMPLTDSQEFPQARILAAGALKKSGDSTLARNLLEGYISDSKIDELMKRK